MFVFFYFFFSSRRRHTRYWRDWSSDVCSSDLASRGAREVGAVDPDEDDVLTGRGGGIVQRLRLELAVDAPRRPEVQDDDLAAVRREVECAGAREERQLHLGLRHDMAVVDLRGDPAAVAVRHVPDE